MASGIVHGAKTSLLIGFVATLVSVFIGIFFGAFAGYFGGLIDDILMRVTEIFQTIPSFIFAILLVAIMKPSMSSIVIAIAVVSWPGVARLVRGEFLAVKNREFVQACHTLGMSDLRIMLWEILPNCLSPIIVVGSLMVATAILDRKWAGLSWPWRSKYHELGFSDWRGPHHVEIGLVGLHLSRCCYLNNGAGN